MERGLVILFATVLAICLWPSAASAEPISALAMALPTMLASAGTAAGAGSAAMSALPLVGTILSAGTGILGGIAAKNASKAEEQVLTQKAAEERAMGSRAAEDRRRQTELVMSKQTAMAADSGAGTQGASIIDIYGDTAQRGSYLARSDYAAGDRQADSYLAKAANAKTKGNNAFTGSILEGFGTAAKGLSSAYKDSGSSWFTQKPTTYMQGR